MHKPDDYTDEAWELVNRGVLCPSCKSTKVKLVDDHFDGVNSNFCYDCEECGMQWEGY